MSVVFLDKRHDGAGAPAFVLQVLEYIPGRATVSNWIASDTLDVPITHWDDPRIDSGLTQRATRGEISNVILEFTSQATYLLALTDEELDTACKTVITRGMCLNRLDRPRVSGYVGGLGLRSRWNGSAWVPDDIYA